MIRMAIENEAMFGVQWPMSTNTERDNHLVRSEAQGDSIHTDRYFYSGSDFIYTIPPMRDGARSDISRKVGDRQHAGSV
jgi:hypothetical protein